MPPFSLRTRRPKQSHRPVPVPAYTPMTVLIHRNGRITETSWIAQAHEDAMYIRRRIADEHKCRVSDVELLPNHTRGALIR